MNLTISILSFFSLFSITNTLGQRVSINDATQRLYLCMSNMPDDFSETVKHANVPNCIYFSNEDIDPFKTGRIDKTSFRRHVNTRVPDVNYKGILVLDWENELFDTLRQGQPNYYKWNLAIKNFIEAIQYAKTLRPKAQWGYWNIPLAIYFVKVDKLWSKRMDASEKLIKECDILMPSLYDVYPTGAVSWQDDTAFITSSLLKTLELAVKYNKPVLPFIWHRYSDAIKESGLKAIEPKEFLTQAKLMASISYKGRKINGIIWWQEDKYFMNIRSKSLLSEMGTKKADDYQNEVLLKYYYLLKTVFN